MTSMHEDTHFMLAAFSIVSKGQAKKRQGSDGREEMAEGKDRRKERVGEREGRRVAGRKRKEVPKNEIQSTWR